MAGKCNRWTAVLTGSCCLALAGPVPPGRAEPAPVTPAVAPTATPPAAAGPTTVILDVSGQVDIYAAGTWHRAEVGGVLLPGQYLATGPDSSVWLAVGATTSVNVEANALIGFRLLRDVPLIDLARGQITTRVHEQQPLAVATDTYYFPRLPLGQLVLKPARVYWYGPPKGKAFMLYNGHMLTIDARQAYNFDANFQASALDPHIAEVPSPSPPPPEPSPSASVPSELLAIPLPSAAPSAGMPPVPAGKGNKGARAVTFQFRSNSAIENQSNVEEVPTGTRGAALHQTISGAARIRLSESGGQLIVNYAHQFYHFLDRSDAFSYGLATLMVDWPIGEHMDVYGGGMRIFRFVTGAPNSADNNFFVGANAFFYPNVASLVYGGYQFNNLRTDSSATSYYGHSVQGGFRQAIGERVLVSVNYNLQLRTAVLQAKFSTRHTLSLDGSYLFTKNIGATLGTRYVIIRQDPGSTTAWTQYASFDLMW